MSINKTLWESIQYSTFTMNKCLFTTKHSSRRNIWCQKKCACMGTWVSWKWRSIVWNSCKCWNNKSCSLVCKWLNHALVPKNIFTTLMKVSLEIISEKDESELLRWILFFMFSFVVTSFDLQVLVLCSSVQFLKDIIIPRTGLYIIHHIFTNGFQSTFWFNHLELIVCHIHIKHWVS